MGFPLPGELRPRWLIVVLQPHESPLTVYHSIRRTGIIEKHSDNDITRFFLMVSGGALAHVSK